MWSLFLIRHLYLRGIGDTKKDTGNGEETGVSNMMNMHAVPSTQLGAYGIVRRDELLGLESQCKFILRMHHVKCGVRLNAKQQTEPVQLIISGCVVYLCNDRF